MPLSPPKRPAAVVVDQQRASACLKGASRSAIISSRSSARCINSPPSTSQRPAPSEACRRYCKSRRPPCRCAAQSIGAAAAAVSTAKCTTSGLPTPALQNRIHLFRLRQRARESRRAQSLRCNPAARCALPPSAKPDRRAPVRRVHVRLGQLFPAPSPRATCSRSISPVERCGTPYSLAASLACVPLPAPGGPRKITARRALHEAAPDQAYRRLRSLPFLDEAFVVAHDQLRVRSAAQCPWPRRPRSAAKCRRNKTRCSGLPAQTATCGCQTTCPERPADAAGGFRRSSIPAAGKPRPDRRRRQTSAGAGCG